MTGSAATPTILIVDDDAAVTRYLREKLEANTSMRVVVVNTLGQAKELIDKAAIPLNAVMSDLLFDPNAQAVDVNILDGLDLLAYASRIRPRAALYVFSFFAEREVHKRQARERGIPIAAWIQKGWDLPSAGPSPWAAIEEKLVRDAIRYDAFISYRRKDPDRAFALEVLQQVESCGLKAAIDERDFESQASFVEEMERCVRQSRFTLCVVSPRYFESGNCQEEAIICKVLDMAERRRRLIPLILERVPMPTWLYNIVGIDFASPSPLVAPFEKLLRDLGRP